MKKNSSLYKILRKIKCKFSHVRYGLRFVHSSAMIGPKCDISKDIIMKEESYIGPNCLIGEGVIIERFAMIGPNVSIVGHDHNFDKVGIPIIYSGRPSGTCITSIKQDAWIGAGSIILRGVTIGSGSIVAAGAVVVKDVPACTIVAGIPAKVVRKRFENDADAAIHIEKIESMGCTGDYCD
ncbi:transferase family hexapeptide repeat protein [Serratia fonticola]|jgi:acetyltransferase-like isoleucine patch superfamily enzyme|uniref:Transferase family hexapeptide repeat protein n=1 Tax=Serratia fonticola TaxID=47917 RepID=A0A542BMH8_SERFO|nr:DapH/DapD/GlmU-related protein [Serratia fonticola]TQI79810.1 transferase family hexapeptide repeat protein [Serratia fonticola]TQI98165.1 transferase family hexapeptide repeat protein [Serratia fonticola]TVZ67693.1 transferase family hexapeptide repeat protein [Serratia fonticola]